MIDPQAATHQPRIIRTLVAGQALGALGMTIGVSTASLLARKLSGSDMLAGFSQTAQVLGAALWSFVLARLMARHGRRLGLVAGYLLGALGASLAVAASIGSRFWVLLVGAVLLGGATAANAAARYAGADLAAPAHKARAISIVVWATTVGAVLGPNLTGPAASWARRLGIPELGGPFVLGAVGMLAAAAVIWVWLRPDPLIASLTTATRAATQHRSPSRPLWELLRSTPVLMAAIAALAGAHATMVAVMIMTPLHMDHGGAGLTVIGFVISVHVLGMFAFAPLSGLVADRLGRGRALALGALVLGVSLWLSGTSAAGSSTRLTAGLFLLGLGWSFATVAGSALIAEWAPGEARTRVQGASDVAMSLAAAMGGALAGLVVGVWGYGALNLGAGALVVVVAGCGVWVWSRATPHPR